MLGGSFIIGLVLALIGILIINRADTPDAASLGFGVFGIGALIGVITLIVLLFGGV
jgi:hypothetical protein